MSGGRPGIGAAGHAASGDTGAGERNKALARRWFEEGWNRGNVAVAPEIFAADFTLRGEPVGPAGPQRSVLGIRAVFSPLTVTLDLQVAEGDVVVTRYTARGLHTASYRGIPATGRWITASGVQIWRVRDGLAVEDWNTFDEWALVSQLDDSRLSVGYGRKEGLRV
jgi:predicted ester cyclase